jgi:hypothetical protein
MGAFGDSWALTKTSFRMIREEKALLLFPLISGLCALAIIIVLAVGLLSVALFTSISGSAFDAIVGIGAIVAYFLLWIVTVYFTGALVAAATIKLNGGKPTVSDGLRAARARLGRLVLWALLGGTIMLLIRIVASRLRGIAGVLFGLGAGLAVATATYFIVPVLMYENESTWRSLKRSAALFVKNFGRTLVSNLALGLILFGGFLLAIVLLVVGILVAGTTLVPGIALVILGVAALIFMLILSSAVEGVLRAALYRFATTGQVVAGLVHPRYLASQGGAVPSGGGPLPSTSSPGTYPPPPLFPPPP